MARDAAHSRIDPRAGFVNPDKVAACRECGKPKEPKCGWRTFCSNECVDAWKLRTQPSHAAELVFKRDAGVCASCGLDCVKLLHDVHARISEEVKRANAAYSAGTGFRFQGRVLVPDVRFGIGLRAWDAEMFALGWGKVSGSRTRLWDMDHVTPVVRGGGSCGLDNYRTLCIGCHKHATRELAADRARERKGGGA